MDFLDPKAKKRHAVRLFVGYILVSILIITASTIIVFQAYGFDVDRKTGEVIQNGLVYIDSAPDGAEIYLNGELAKSRTNTKLVLPEGRYELMIKKDGYRDWRRTFELMGGSVARLTYPILLLDELKQDEVADYGQTKPLLSTQSPDRRWLLVSKNASVNEYFEYDLANLDQEQIAPQEENVTFPASLFKAADGQVSMEEVEWSTDNKNVLVKYTYGSGYEFIVLNRDEPAASININQLLGVNPTEITLRDKKFDQWYLYNADAGTLQSADRSKTITPIVSSVVSYKTHDDTIVLYAQKKAENIVNVYMRQENRTMLIRSVADGSVALNIAKFDGVWYMGIGSDGDKKTYIYKDPAGYMERNPGGRPPVVSVLRVSGPLSGLTFSTNTRFIMAHSGQEVRVYDFEKGENFAFTITEPIDAGSKAEWMDGHRIATRSAGALYLTDFDGSNHQKVVKTLPGKTAFFDRDYTVIYSLDQAVSEPPAYKLFSTDLRSEADK